MDSISSDYAFWSSRPEVFFKKVVLKNFEIYQSFIKKETLAQMFYCKICEFFKDKFFIEHLWWLLLMLPGLLLPAVGKNVSPF